MIKLSEYDLERRKHDEEICRVDQTDRIRISDLVSKHGPDIYLVVEIYSDYSYDDVIIKVIREQEESDEEYDARISALRKLKSEQAEKDALARKRAKEREAEKDRVLFEKLKSKYDW